MSDYYVYVTEMERCEVCDTEIYGGEEAMRSAEGYVCADCAVWGLEDDYEDYDEGRDPGDENDHEGDDNE